MTTQGRLSVVTIATNDISPYVNNTQFQRGNDILDSTTYGQVGHKFVGGLTNGKVTITGVWDKSATVGATTVFAALVGVGTETAMVWSPEGTASGTVKYSCNFVLEDYTESSPVADIISYTATLQISGAVTKGTNT